MAQSDEARPGLPLGAPAAETGSKLQLGVLGTLRATVDGAAVHLGGRRQSAVVAVLLMARGSPVPTYRLIEAVWGDE